MLPRGAEVELRGTIGTAYANNNRYEIVPERGGAFQDPKPRRKDEVVKATDGDLDRQAARDFLDCVKARRRPTADIEEGHRSTTFAHLANIALATRKRLDWDAKAERFPTATRPTSSCTTSTASPGRWPDRRGTVVQRLTDESLEFELLTAPSTVVAMSVSGLGLGLHMERG